MAGAGTDPLSVSLPLGPTKVVLTIDDLPAGTGTFASPSAREHALQKIIAALKRHHIKDAYGFSNGTKVESDPDEKRILAEWLAAGQRLGNHTVDHVNLNQVGEAAFINEIAKEDAILAKVDTAPGSAERRRVFRYPYLSEGDTLEKREAVRKYLLANGYRIAEVTTDYFDWAWNETYQRCGSQHDENSMQWLMDHVLDAADRQLRRSNAVSQLFFHYRLPQIVLIHLNAFNALMIEDILQRWQNEGVQFISLDEALRQPMYHFDAKVAYPGGMTFFDQIAAATVVSLSSYEETVYSVEQLSSLCRPSKAR